MQRFGMIEVASQLNQRVVSPAAIMILQAVAAVFFAVDAIEDYFELEGQPFNTDVAMEGLIAFGLLGAVVLSSRYIWRMTRDLRRQAQSLARAKGALSSHIAQRFQEWGLTPGEGQVALFALKGCDVAEIARLRGAAHGTIRSQLSQIYAKAGVTSQATFVSLFIDDLLDTPTFAA